MPQYIYKISSVCLISLVFIFIGCNSHDGEYGAEREGYPKFAVISDLHFGKPDAVEKVSRALKMIVSQDPVVDAIFVVGDITDFSRSVNYDDAISTFEANVPTSIPVYYMMGNHDRTLDEEGLLFTSKTKQPVNQFIDIKGYPFITVSVKEGITAVNGERCYSEETKNFLAEKMAFAAAIYRTKPIFVFYHVPVSNTVWGSSEPDNMGSEMLESTMNNYDQAIAFSGHTHYTIVDERSIHQKYFTSVNDGGSTYGSMIKGMENGVRPESSREVTEALIVTVLPNEDIIIKRLDTYRGEEIKNPWIIKAPHDGTNFKYTDERTGGDVPAFKHDDVLTITNIDLTSCTLTIPQAFDDDIVFSYEIEVIDTDGNISQTINVFSDCWLNKAKPTTITWNIKKLAPLTSYIISVKAVDSFDNKSEPINSTMFKTSNPR